MSVRIHLPYLEWSIYRVEGEAIFSTFSKKDDDKWVILVLISALDKNTSELKRKTLLILDNDHSTLEGNGWTDELVNKNIFFFYQLYEILC